MIYLTNRQILRCLDNLSKREVKEILNFLEIIVVLLKRVVNRVNTKVFFDVLKKNCKEVYDVVCFLKKINKFDVCSLEVLIQEVREKYDLDKNFLVQIYDDSKVESVIEVLKQKFGSDIKVNIMKMEDIGLFVKGRGYYYKRNLKMDIDKLLN